MSIYLYTNNKYVVATTSGIIFTITFSFGCFIAIHARYIFSMMKTICDRIYLQKLSVFNICKVGSTDIDEEVVCYKSLV